MLPNLIRDLKIHIIYNQESNSHILCFSFSIANFKNTQINTELKFLAQLLSLITMFSDTYNSFIYFSVRNE